MHGVGLGSASIVSTSSFQTLSRLASSAVLESGTSSVKPRRVRRPHPFKPVHNLWHRLSMRGSVHSRDQKLERLMKGPKSSGFGINHHTVVLFQPVSALHRRSLQK